MPAELAALDKQSNLPRWLDLNKFLNSVTPFSASVLASDHLRLDVRAESHGLDWTSGFVGKGGSTL